VVVVVVVVVVMVVKFDNICHAERFGLFLATGCDRIASLTLCNQQHPLKLSAKLQLKISVHGLTTEVGVQLAQDGFGQTIVCRPS